MIIDDIRSIAVIGAGLMGHGIAQEFAVAGYDVHLHDVSEVQLQQAIDKIHHNLDQRVTEGAMSGEQAELSLSRIYTHKLIDEAVANVDVVIEAIFEDLPLKQAIFRMLDEECPERTILASNSSTLMPGQLAIATQRPDKVLVTHYFNPPHLLPLVEVVRHEGTSDETVQVIYELMLKIGKSPAIINKEAPGFVGNRLQMALFREALSLVEQGIASPQDIDTVVKTGFGRRYAAAGPFEIWELVGWDLIKSVSNYLTADLNRDKKLSLLDKMVREGKLGVKSGEGFYQWTPESAEALRLKIARMMDEIQRLTSSD